jgi:large subunit ribosomal protein L9
MQLLLVKDVSRLGHVGDVVEVGTAYARNYLVPQHVAVEPTPENLKAIEAEKKRAAAERARRAKEFQDLAERLSGASVTIEATANPEGTLYGSVGAREIAEALLALGHAVRPEQIALDEPIRTLDNVSVTIRLTDEISTQVKVWVVREGAAADGEQPDATQDEESAADDYDE